MKMWIGFTPSRREFLRLSVGYLTTDLSIGHVLERAPSAFLTLKSNLWVNLHHFVRAESRRASRKMALEFPVSALSNDEQMDWQKTLTYYQSYAEKSLLFDEPLKD